MEKVQYHDLANCVRLYNDEIEIVVTTEIGPRIVGYSLVGGENVLGYHPHARVETALGTWKPYGGHRLWIAPENMPNSYAPDDAPIEYFYNKAENSIRLIQPAEAATKTRKEIIVTVGKTGSEVRIEHKITNLADEPIELSLWGLTIMRPGGEIFIPNETFAPYSAETLLPVRNLTCWSYTDFSDSRWRFEKDFIRLRVDENKPEPQKIGVLNTQSRALYRVGDWQFTKKIEFIKDAKYPDMNSNMEFYTAGSFVEIESLSPLQTLAFGETAKHEEIWKLEKV